MDEKPLVIVNDPPGVVLGGSGEGYASLSLSTVERVQEIVSAAREAALAEPAEAPLRQPLIALSEATELLASEVHTLLYGISEARIAVTRDVD